MCTGARSIPAGNETASWWDTYRSKDFSSSRKLSPFTKSDISIIKSSPKPVPPSSQWQQKYEKSEWHQNSQRQATAAPRPTSTLTGPLVTPSVTDPYAELRKQYWMMTANRK